MKVSKKKNGFSLVELLVVVAVVLVLTGIGSYSISNFTQNKGTAELRDYLSDQIKLARNLSITNQLPDKTIDLAYVKVSILDNKLLTVEAVKNDGSVVTDPPYFSDNLDNKGNISITMTDNLVSINSFGFLGKTGRLTNANGEASSGPVVLRVVKGSESYTLTINDLGMISND